MANPIGIPPSISLLLQKRGALSKLAREIGVTRQALYQWRRVPAERVLTVERVTGIPRTELRPDLYPRGAA